MAVRVVDLLEVIDVDKQHRNAGTPLPRLGQRLLQSLEEECPIRQTGQYVVFGAASKLRLDDLSLRDVARRDRDAVTQLDRLMRDPRRRDITGRAELFRQ